LYRAFDLEHAIAAEKDDCGVGLVAGYFCRCREAKAGRIALQLENRILRCGGWRLFH